MRAIKDCFESLRIHHGWGIAEVAQHLGVHYETARRLRAGEIKEPSFTLVAGLHRLAERSLDHWVGITPQALGSDSPQIEDRVREMVVDQLSIMLARGLTLQLPGSGNGRLQVDGDLLRPKSGAWPVNDESRPTEEALLKAGRLLGAAPAPAPDAESTERIKRRQPSGNRSAAASRR